MAKGNFNGDEFFDVAVGAPGERVGSVGFAGAVNVLYGSEDGLTGGPLFVQSNPESSDGFGGSLATVDFNGDGFFDLAVGVPGENVGAVVDAGAVTVLFGSAGGITTAGSQTLFQGGGAAGTAETGDNFGFSVATGILAGNDVADLVVGVPGEDVGSVQDAGAVNLLSGTAGGLVNGSLATQGNPEGGDAFGIAVATGDFDDTAGDDVAVGAPGETVNGRPAPARSACSTAHRPGSPPSGCCSRDRPASPARPRAATASGRRWPRPTATASASGTWPSGSPARTSGPTRTPGSSTCWPGRSPAPAGASR